MNHLLRPTGLAAVALAGVLSLAACGSDHKPANTTPPTTTAAPTSTTAMTETTEAMTDSTAAMAPTTDVMHDGTMTGSTDAMTRPATACTTGRWSTPARPEAGGHVAPLLTTCTRD